MCCLSLSPLALASLAFILLSCLSGEASAKPRAVVHIGVHKTSSTYIQAQLCLYRDELARQGFVLPVCRHCNTCNAKHFATLALALVENDKSWQSDYFIQLACSDDPIGCFKESLPTKADGSSSSDNVIISSEAFDQIGIDGAQRLAALLAGYDVSIVVFHRDKHPLLLSYYAESFKQRLPPRSETLADHLAAMVNTYHTQAQDPEFLQQPGKGHVAHGLLFSGLVRMYTSVFGPGSVHVVSYEGLRSAGRDPFEFLVEEVAGVSLPDAQESTTIASAAAARSRGGRRRGGRRSARADGVALSNPSPVPLAISVVAHLHALVGGLPEGSSPRCAILQGASLTSGRAGPTDSQGSKEGGGGRGGGGGSAAGGLPLTCDGRLSDLAGLVHAWQREEAEALRSMDVRLWHFRGSEVTGGKEDGKEGGRLAGDPPKTAGKFCDIDEAAVREQWQHWEPVLRAAAERSKGC